MIMLTATATAPRTSMNRGDTRLDIEAYKPQKKGLNAMKLTPIASNVTQLSIPEYDVLFSYSTPVAAYSRIDHKWYQTEQWYSKTTTRHINRYADGNAEHRPQEFFDGLVK